MTLRRRSLVISTSAVLAALLLCVAVLGVLSGWFDTARVERVAGGGAETVRIALAGVEVDPGVLVVDRGTDLSLEVANEDGEVHDLSVDGRSPGTRMLSRGESERIDLGEVTRPIRLWCTVPGHKLAGMKLDVEVAAGSR